MQLYRASNGHVVLLGCCSGKDFTEAIVNPPSSTSISECEYLLVLSSSISSAMELVSSAVFTAEFSRVDTDSAHCDKRETDDYVAIQPSISEFTIGSQPILSSRTLHRIQNVSNLHRGIESARGALMMLPPQLRDITQHIVIVIVPSKESNVPCENLLVALICILKPLKAKFPSNAVVVLSEHAQSLLGLVSEVNHQLGDILQDTYFVAGSGSNPDHLSSIRITTSRVISVIHPILKRIELPLAEYERLHADEQVILTALSISLMTSNALSVTELVYHHNSSFLHIKTTNRHETAEDWESQSNSIIDEPYESYCPYQSGGFVLSHSMLNALLIQCVFSPALISFWEKIILHNQMTVMHVPKELVGRRASSAFEYILLNSGAIVVGVLNHGRKGRASNNHPLSWTTPMNSEYFLDITDELFVIEGSGSGF